VLNSLRSAMSEHRRVLGSAIPTRQHTFAVTVHVACVLKTSSSRCQSLPSQTISGLVGSVRPFRAHPWVCGCYWASAGHASANIFLGKGQRDTLQSGFTGNHILISQASPTLAKALPPCSTDLKDAFVVIFGRDADDLRKCQLLTVQREAYKALAAERARVNAIFAEISVDQAAVNALPLHGVPQQFLDCAVQMPEVDRYSATRSGPGTIRDPLDAACPEDDASDELAEIDDDEHAATPADHVAPASAAQPSTASQNVEHLNQFETPIGMDPTAVPSFVQHMAAFKHNLEHVRELVSSSSSSSSRTLSGQSDSSAAQPASLATARAAAEEQCFRAVVDLREAARQLNTHNWERNLALLDKAAECDKALFVPSQKPLSMFDPTTWSKCFPSGGLATASRMTRSDHARSPSSSSFALSCTERSSSTISKKIRHRTVHGPRAGSTHRNTSVSSATPCAA